jgi:lysophospholipase L1-like esterase
MVTLGDSIMWGQGLPEGMKFRNIVAGWLQSQFQGSRTVNQVNRAHSGAQIAVDPGEGDYETGLPGEIPSGHPSVTKQVDLAVSDLMRSRIDPHLVDLVLLDGGINDVGVFDILLPTNSTGKVRQLTNEKCVGRMARLLPYVMRMYPNAAVVVTGYYPIASADSDVGALLALIGALGGGEIGGATGGIVAVAGGVLGAASKDQIVNNSTEFNNDARSGLSGQVNQFQPAGHPRLALAWPEFQSQNSYAAPSTFLWSLGQFTGDETNGVVGRDPESPSTVNGVAWTRARACAVANRATPKCDDASMGHPNQYGAQAYADAVIRQLVTTLSPYLATRGLVENPACTSLRAQEATAMGTVRGVQDSLAEMGKEQKDCQAGKGPEGESAKPKQCGALEIMAEKKKLNASMEQANAQLKLIEQHKAQARCWY